jgi:hypothetical protein
MPPPVTYAIIATMGRASIVSQLLAQLERQSTLPAGIILSASQPSDIPDLTNHIKTEVTFGSPGLAAQRNRALKKLPPEAQFVVFFDDDFIPSIFWIERLQQFFAHYTQAVAMTGHVIADGVRSGGIKWSEGLSIVEQADKTAATFDMDKHAVHANRSPYGCNMAYRLDAIRNQTFDERLVHYGWLEDLDFGFRTANRNRDAFWTDAVWGVHLGVKVARRSDLSFGYSQVVNPWYLLRKGAMTSVATMALITRGIAKNTVKLAIGDPHFDRFDRIKGNAIGVADIVRGRWRPERAGEF